MVVNKNYEYVDHLKEYMRDRAERFVEEMGDHYPKELLDLKASAPDKLAILIEDGATPILRKIEDDAIRTAAFRVVTMIAWSKSQVK